MHANRRRFLIRHPISLRKIGVLWSLRLLFPRFCLAPLDHRSDGTMKKFITSQIYNKIAFSLYSSLLSIRYFELGRSNKVRHRFRLFFFKRTILLLIHHQFLQFWYQSCIKKTSIYHIIGNFPPNCRRNTRKTDEVYDFLQSAKLTCVDDLWI